MGTKRDLVHRCASNFCCEASYAALLHTLLLVGSPGAEPHPLRKGLLGSDPCRAPIHVITSRAGFPRQSFSHVSMASWRCPSCIVAFFASRHF